MLIDGVQIHASGFNPGRDELANYVSYVKQRQPDVKAITVVLDDYGNVDLHWTCRHVPFERIRRITGR